MLTSRRRRVRVLFAALATAAALVAAAVIAGATSGSSHPHRSARVGPIKAYVGLFKDNAVAVLDTGTNRVVKTIPVPAGPHGMVITPDDRTVYVSSDGSSTVSVIDTASDRVTRTIEVGATPHGLALTPDAKTLLVAGFGTGEVSFIDLTSKAVTARVAVPSPHNIAISPDGRRAYVASQVQGGASLAIVDVRSKSMVGRVALDRVPRALVFSPDGKRVYFTEAGSSDVHVLDTGTNAIVDQLSVGISPHQPAFVPLSKALVVVVQGPGQLAVVDPATKKVDPVSVGQMPHWVALSTDGGFAYVTNEGSGTVSVIALDSNHVIATVPVGGGPRKIVIQSGLVAPPTGSG